MLIKNKEVNETIFDFSKLKGRIIEKFGSQSAFAKVYKISKNSLSLKMNGKVPFSSDDIIKFSKLLDISRHEIGEYFFTPKV